MSPSHFFLVLFLVYAGLFFTESIYHEYIVNTYTQWDQYNPSIDADDEGNFVITWVSDKQDGELTGIFARMFYKNGYPKGPEFQVNTAWEHLQEWPAVAVGRTGNFVITWVSYIIEGQSGAGLSARVFDKDGNPISSEFQVNDYTGGYQGEPAAAMDGEGNFVIVWQSWEQDRDSFGIFARKYDQNGNPQGPEFQVNNYSENDQIHPAIAMDKDGNFVVVWTSYGQDGDKTGIFAQRFSRDGNRLGSEFRVNFSTVGWQEWPDIAMDESSNFIICWHSYQYSEDSYEIFARTFDKTTILKGTEFRVNSHSEDWQIFPTIDADKEGNFLIAWQSLEQNGDSFGIFAKIFDQYGQPQGKEFQVNNSVLGSQEAPDVIMFDKQNFGIAWQSFQQDDSGWDIYARIFKNHTNLLNKPREFNIKKHEFKKIFHFSSRFSAHTTVKSF